MEDKFNSGGTTYVVDGREVAEEEYQRMAAAAPESKPEQTRKKKEVNEDAVA